MGNVSVRDAREFLNLSVKRPRMHLLDEPTGYISAMAKSNLGHQMHYGMERLEAELAASGEPRVLQLVCEGDEREPQSWTLYADGLKCAHGTGEFARACFCEAAEAFMSMCRDAVRAAVLPSAAHTITSCCAPPADLRRWRRSGHRRRNRRDQG